MYKVEELQKIVAAQIAKINLPNYPDGLYQPIRYSLESGGKRLRSVLTLMAANMFSDNIDSVIHAALALEVFHNFTLLHDDLMDNADIRRNKPTIHKKWSANTAILSGDAMLIKSYQLIDKADVSNKDKIVKIFSQTALEVCEGQQYDMNFEDRIDVTESEYINMIKLKTSVLLAACLKIGALSCNAASEDANKLYEFGLNIGLVFQLQDDYLDTFGDERIFGKKIGGDIVANKKTYLLIKALELANENQKAELKVLITQEKFDRKEKVEAVTKIYRDLEIEKHTKEKIAHFNNLSIIKLSALNINSDKKLLLSDFANSLINRIS